MLVVSKIDRNENIEYFDDGWVGKGIPHRFSGMRNLSAILQFTARAFDMFREPSQRCG